MRTGSLLFGLLMPVAIAAQQPAAISLKRANGVLPDSLAGRSVRELRDGRVLIATGSHLVLADFAKGTATPLPGAPSGLLVRLGGDTTLIEDRNNGWVFLEGARVLGMLPLSNPVVRDAPSPSEYGADSLGFVLGVTGGWPDSAKILRINRASGEERLLRSLWQSVPARGGIPAPVFVVNEQPVLAFDGWIAVVRAHPYRVDWRTPAGEWILGRPLPVPAVKMDAREQEAYFAKWGSYRPDPSVKMEWPEWVEPFTYPMPLATPDGKLLVRRNATADRPGDRYDLINRRGELEEQILLPGKHAQVVGFGPHSIYVVVADSSRPPHLQLERHPWP